MEGKNDQVKVYVFCKDCQRELLTKQSKECGYCTAFCKLNYEAEKIWVLEHDGN